MRTPPIQALLKVTPFVRIKTANVILLNMTKHVAQNPDFFNLLSQFGPRHETLISQLGS